MSTLAAATSLKAQIANDGYAFASADQVHAMIGADEPIDDFIALWDDLRPDEYLQGDYTFRHRRYSQVAFIPTTRHFSILPAVPYEQSTEINAYAGGIQRVFAPITQETVDSPVFRGLVATSFEMLDIDEKYQDQQWTIEVHMFRLTARGVEQTHPTPEGIHRDGVPMGALHLIGRQGIEGGVSHIYSPSQEPLGISTLREPLDSFYAWDTRVMHYATPLFASENKEGYRDVLVYGFHLEGTEYERG